MIKINRIYVDDKKSENEAFLAADIELSEQDIHNWIVNMEKIENRNFRDVYRYEYLSDGKFTMWYSVPAKFSDQLCYERCDAFVVGLVYFAIVSGADIYSAVPMTDRLYYQLTSHLVPGLCKNTRFRPIDIICECCPELEKDGAFVGTGASGGVDSFASILLGMDEKLPESFKLTHLCYFNVGALNFAEYLKPYTLESWNKNANEEFRARTQIARSIADGLGLELFTVNSNISDLYQGSFLYSLTYRTCSAVLATQKMWGKYYFASAGYGYEGEISVEVDSARFDNYILNNLCLDKLSFYSSGANHSRFEKTELLCENAVAQKYLNVCSFEVENCGECSKCVRTILALDVLGRLDDFSEAFKHLDGYKKNKHLYWGQVRYAENDDVFFLDLKKNIEDRGVAYPPRIKLYPWHRRVVSVKRFLKKVLKGSRSVASK